MRVCCPSCRAEMDAALFLQAQEDRQALAAILVMGLPMGAQLLRYVSLFRTGPNALSLTRTQRLLAELLPDIQRGVVNVKGRDWLAPPELWLAAFDKVQANREAGLLHLPLRSHAYLHEIVVSLSDSAEATAERGREQQLRSRAPVGSAADVIADMDHALANAPRAVDQLTALTGQAQEPRPLSKPGPGVHAMRQVLRERTGSAALQAVAGHTTTSTTNDNNP